MLLREILPTYFKYNIDKFLTLKDYLFSQAHNINIDKKQSHAIRRVLKFTGVIDDNDDSYLISLKTTEGYLEC